MPQAEGNENDNFTSTGSGQESQFDYRGVAILIRLRTDEETEGDPQSVAGLDQVFRQD
jgi:hypothetical protein